MLAHYRRRATLLLFFILFFLSGCTATQQVVKQETAPPPTPVEIVIKPGYISGKVTFNDQPMAGAVVDLYQDTSSNFQGPAAITSELTGIDGSFRVSVPTGGYYVVARSKGNGEEYYTYYGGNPLNITPGQEWPIGLSLIKQRAPETDKLITGMPQGTGIRGMVYVGDKPLNGAQVMVYLNANSNFKGLGYDQRFSDSRGRFILDLSEGTYFIIARKRKSGRMAGPLITGDYYAYYAKNPIQVKAGKYIDVALSAVKKMDKLEENTKGRTIISGMVVDEVGKPVTGVYVGAYTSSQVMGKPDYVSPLTETDGRFKLELPDGGKYFLMSRNTYAGPPIPGDLVGWYQGSADHSVTIETGQKLNEVKIIISPMF